MTARARARTRAWLELDPGLELGLELGQELELGLFSFLFLLGVCILSPSSKHSINHFFLF